MFVIQLKALAVSIEYCLKLKSSAGLGSMTQLVECLLHTHEN